MRETEHSNMLLETGWEVRRRHAWMRAAGLPSLTRSSDSGV